MPTRWPRSSPDGPGWGPGPRRSAAGHVLFLVLLLVLAVASGSCGAGNTVPAPDSVDAAAAPATPATQLAREITSAPRFQSSLPEAEPTPADAGLGSVSPGFAVLFKLLVYAMIAVVLALIAVWVVGTAARRGANDPDAAGEPDTPATGPAHGLGLSAETLAGEGRYGEAIHALLLIAIAHLKGRGSLRPHPAMTSREIVHRLTGDAPVREALGQLVRRVERSHFGAEPAGPDDWALCRQYFRAATGEDPA